jgi:hypothetical protein
MLEALFQHARIRPNLDLGKFLLLFWIFMHKFFVITPKENVMNKLLLFILLMIVSTLSACAPASTLPPDTLPDSEPAATVESQIPSTVPPTQVEAPPAWKTYTNSAFGLSFHYPRDWFGPDEYISGQTLRVEVGSDTVFPYGNPPEQPSEVKNSYKVVIQYTKDNQNTFLDDTHQTLLTLKDGESLSSPRSQIIRIRGLDFGRFQGFEYISTLSETAQTEPFYAREIYLMDDQANLITIFGTPNNVEISNGAEWREVYRGIDQANLNFFHEIVESLEME